MKAFPHTYKHPTSGLFIEEQGMDLRDWFAGLVMQAIYIKCSNGFSFSSMASSAYSIADAMLEQREKTDEGL